jgi:tRNA (mo5U34)-methyltransferase
MPLTDRAMTAGELRRRVSEINWFHRIELGDKIVTPGTDKSPQKLDALRLPSLVGKTVLDIGANDGFFSFAAERAGAARVVAVDSFCWTSDAPGGQTKAGFDLAHEVLDSNVEAIEADLYDLTPENVGSFDVVLMLGVLYHCREPLLAIERLASLTKELLVVESLVDLVWMRRPAAAFYPGADVVPGDESNWWGPNPAALSGMVRACGFAEVELVGQRTLPSKLGHAAYNAANIFHSRVARGRSPLRWAYLSTDRAIVHARR